MTRVPWQHSIARFGDSVLGGRRVAPMAVAAALAVAAGCGGKEGNEPNALPSAPGTGGSSTGADDDGASTMPATGDGQGSGSESGEGGVVFPQTYRFECVDIQIVGDGDGETIQAKILEGAWTDDINNTKLNIMLTVVERDEAAGTAMLQISSGVGATTDSLCNQADTISPVYPAGYEPGVATWADGRDEPALCSQDGAGSDGVGTYTFTTTPDDVVYIYAEDDDGTTFNCVPGGRAPDAVPIRAIEATVTMAPEERQGFGSLTGCLTVREAMGLCSCIGQCVGDPVPECDGCPNGSRPLAALLGGINPSPRCTDLTGEDAFDLQLGMTTQALGVQPQTCG